MFYNWKKVMSTVGILLCMGLASHRPTFAHGLMPDGYMFGMSKASSQLMWGALGVAIIISALFALSNLAEKRVNEARDRSEH